MKSDTFLVLLSLLTLSFFFACQPASNEENNEAAQIVEKALAPQDVELVKPELREEHPTLKLVGEIRPFETVSISTEVVGNIDRVLVEVGDRVATGAALVEVDRETYRLRLAQAEANLQAAQAELNLAAKELARKKDLLSDKTIAQAIFDQAEARQALAAAQVGSAIATRDLAQRDLDRSIIRSPADGIIAKRHSVAGQWADINQSLLEIAMGSEVKIATRVPEVWMPNLSGLKGFDFTVGASSETYHAKLFSIEPVVSQNSRSFEIVGTMKIAEAAVRPGMFANVQLTSPTQQQSLWLPSSAVASSDMPEVMMVIDDVISMRKVQTNRRDNGLVEIIAGLEADEEVVLNVAGLGRGIPVHIIGGSDDVEQNS